MKKFCVSQENKQYNIRNSKSLIGEEKKYNNFS